MRFPAYLERLRRIYERERVELVVAPGATAQEVGALTKAVGAPGSDALIELWRTANGSRTPVLSRPGYFTGYEILSTKRAVAYRAAMKKRARGYAGYEEREPRDPRIRSSWYEDGWIPFASFGGGSLSLLEDHAPSGVGTRGQIIGFVHDPDQLVFVAQSLPALLADSLAQIDGDPYEHGIHTR